MRTIMTYPFPVLRFLGNAFSVLVLSSILAASSSGAVIWVSPSGSDGNGHDGTWGKPYRQIQKAINVAPSETTTILVAAGTYASVSIQHKQRSSNCRIRARHGHEGMVVIHQSNANWYKSSGIRINNCKNFYFNDIDVTGFQEAVRVERSSEIRFYTSYYHDLGLNGMCICKNSHHVLIAECNIGYTGRRPASNSPWAPSGRLYAEGVYLGSSDFSENDHTNNVLIYKTHIHHTTAEGVDVKGGCHSIRIESCSLYDIELDSGGAISVKAHQAGTNPGPPTQILYNNLKRISSWTIDVNGNNISPAKSEGIAVQCRANSLVRKNTIHARDRGILLLPKAGSQINVQENRIFLDEASSNYIADIHVITQGGNTGAYELQGNQSFIYGGNGQTIPLGPADVMLNY